MCFSFHRATLYDISDPLNPAFVATTPPVGMTNPSMASVTWDGQVLAVADQGEGFGLGSTCAGDASVSDVYFFDIEDPASPQFIGDYRVPRRVIPTARRFPACSIWDLTVLPMIDPARYVVSVGNLAAGFALVDFTDPANAEEIGHYTDMEGGLSASDTSHAYWYNGRFYAAEMQTMKGIRVLEVDGFNADAVHYFRTRHNPQTQIASFGEPAPREVRP